MSRTAAVTCDTLAVASILARHNDVAASIPDLVAVRNTGQTTFRVLRCEVTTSEWNPCHAVCDCPRSLSATGTLHLHVTLATTLN